MDEIVLSDTRQPGLLLYQAREFSIEKHYLNLPVKQGVAKRNVTVIVGGHTIRTFEIELADGPPDWWAVLDVRPWHGEKLTLQVDRLPEDSDALKAIEQGDSIKGARNLYREALRPQFHFSSRCGWNNDPNGLVFYRGDYHLFYQHNPYGWNWGNMHWGHAVSKDLVHWAELGDALAPDEFGPMFSGSAVVDWKNSSGFGKNGEPPLVLVYTAAGNPTVQCIAYSTDGRTFTKYAGNPVVKQIAGGNRDPKVIWYEPAHRWVMALYVEMPSTTKDANGRPEANHTIQFLSSSDLKDWTVMSQAEDFFECPDFYKLPVEGEANSGRWVLTAASSEYELGSFDGTIFTAETPKLPGHQGDGFYAAQTFSDVPANDGRRIEMGWLQAPSPGMAFNQAMSLPLELKLLSTPDGPRLARLPVKEIESLRARAYRYGALSLKPGDDPLARMRGELIEIRADFEPGDAEEIGFHVRGASIVYNAKNQEIIVNGRHAPAPLRDGRQRLVVYLDRTALEVFASDGLTYVPKPFIAKTEDRSVEVFAAGGSARFRFLEVYELKSAW